VKLTIDVSGFSAELTKDVSCEEESEDGDPTASFTINKLDGECTYDFIALDGNADEYQWKLDGAIIGSSEHVLGYALPLSDREIHIIELTVTSDDVVVTLQKEFGCSTSDTEVTAEYDVNLIEEGDNGSCTFNFIAHFRGGDSYLWTVDGATVATTLDLLHYEHTFDSEDDFFEIKLEVEYKDEEHSVQKEVRCKGTATPSLCGFTHTETDNDGRGTCFFDFKADDSTGTDYQWLLDGKRMEQNTAEFNTSIFFGTLATRTIQLTVFNGREEQTYKACDITCVMEPYLPSAEFSAVEDTAAGIQPCTFDIAANITSYNIYEWTVDDKPSGIPTDTHTWRKTFDFSTATSIRIGLKVEDSSGQTTNTEQTIQCSRSSTPTPKTASNDEIQLISAVREPDGTYKVTLDTAINADLYRWEIETQFRSNSKSPTLTFNFSADEEQEVTLKPTANNVQTACVRRVHLEEVAALAASN